MIMSGGLSVYSFCSNMVMCSLSLRVDKPVKFETVV
jgi:hypothetical protein